MNFVKVGEVLNKVSRKKKIQTSDYLETGLIPIIDQSTKFIAGYTNDEESKYNSPLPIIIFGDHTRILKYIDFPFACGADGTQLLYPEQNILDTAYFYYALKNVNLSNYFYARHFKFLKDQVIPFHSLEKQIIISGILLQYDNLISNNLRRIELLEKSAELLYNEWFLNLRFPGYEKAEINKGIPNGWQRKKIGDKINLIYGKSLKADNRQKGNIPVYGSSGVVGYHDNFLVNGPGIIVGRKGNVGSVFWSEVDYFPIDTVYYVQPDQVSPYVYYNLVYQKFQSSHGAVPGLNRDYAYSQEFLFPDEDIMIAFNEYSRIIRKQIFLLEKQNKKLIQARDLLLPKLINGEIEI